MTSTIVARQSAIVIPVKLPEIAKTRLSDAVGDLRPHLARAFAADTTAAALACSDVSRVVVVTDDDEVSRTTAMLGAKVVDDTPDAGLNPALEHGVNVARAIDPHSSVATLSADLPALRPEELSVVLQAARAYPAAFLPDAGGTGTTLYATAPGQPFAPRFGPGSRHAHLEAGAIELSLAGVDSVRRDVDTADDLWDAMRLGLGQHSGGLIVQLDIVF